MRILLAEDDTLLGGGVRTGLAQAGFAVAWVRDGTEAQQALATEPYDAVVLDLGLPGLDGLSVLRWLRTQHNPVPVLILTASDAVEDRVAGLDAGADDYLTKPFAIQELEARIAVLIRRGRKSMGGGALRVADLVLDPETMTVHRGDLELRLSPTGFQLLNILMRESPRVVSRQEIEREIWKGESPDSDTLRSHLYNLRKTVDRPFDNPLLHTMQTAGYKVADLSGTAASREGTTPTITAPTRYAAQGAVAGMH
jgi:DNA-binding response OmpR family regulator